MDLSDAQSDEITRVSKRPGWLKGVAVGAGLLILYVTVLVLYAIGDADDRPDKRSPAADGVLVYVDVDAVDGSGYSLGGHVSVYPGADLLDDRGYLKNDLSIDVAPMVSDQPIEFAGGSRPGILPVTLYTYGDIRVWPFDTYRSEEVSVRGISTVDGAQVPVDTEIAITDALRGWHIESDGGDLVAGESFTIEAKRSVAALIFDLALCVMLVVLPMCTLFVAIQTVRRRKAFQPPMVTWFAVSLFAVVPLRNIFPGSPPYGSWVDFTVVLWVLAGLITAMALYVFAWFRQAP